jgi:cardiolipin synthase C
LSIPPLQIFCQWCNRLVFAVLFLFSVASCRTSEVAIMPSEKSLDDFSNPNQLGTYELWQKVIEETKTEKKAKLLLLDHGDEALAARINLIRSSQKSVRIQTFNWKTDETGRFVLWELLRAVNQRGIQVEILIDQMFGEQDPQMVAFLSSFDPNFRIKFYNPTFNQLDPSTIEKLADLAYDFHSFNARHHNKLFIVDDQLVITGGRNYANHYFDRAIGLNYKDRDILVVTPDPEPALNSFREYWESGLSVSSRDLGDIRELIEDQGFPSLLTKENFRLNHLFGELSKRSSEANYVHDTFIKPMAFVQEIKWVFDSPDKTAKPSESQGRVAQELSELVANAKREIVIQSPYVVLSEKAIALFRQIKAKNPELRIVVSTNSLAATDSWTTYAANYKEKRLYLEELGFEMWEFKPMPPDIHNMMAYDDLLSRRPTNDEIVNYRRIPFKIDKSLPAFPFRLDASGTTIYRLDRRNDHLHTPPFLSMHAKSMVVDEEVAYVGSFNFDPRSVDYNTEVGLIVRDKAFAKKLRQSIQSVASPENSYRIAIQKGVPVIRTFNRVLNRISESLPLIDPWPFRIYSSFRLRQGMEPVLPSNPMFYENWEDVGNFPQLGFFARKKVAARLFKSAAMILKPLL